MVLKNFFNKEDYEGEIDYDHGYNVNESEKQG